MFPEFFYLFPDQVAISTLFFHCYHHQRISHDSNHFMGHSKQLTEVRSRLESAEAQIVVLENTLKERESDLSKVNKERTAFGRKRFAEGKAAATDEIMGKCTKIKTRDDHQDDTPDE